MSKENLIEKIKSLVPNDTEIEIRHNDLFVHNGTKYLLWEIMNDDGLLWVDYESSGNICTNGRLCLVLNMFDTEIVQHILEAIQANIQEK